MNHATVQGRNHRRSTDAHPQQSPTDILVDLIAGSSRAQLEGQPVAVIHAALCAQLREMGLRPNESKVRRIAAWISAANVSSAPSAAA